MQRDTTVVAILLISAASACAGDTQLDEADASTLAIPHLSLGPPEAGRRVAVTSPEYKGTRVAHTVYLPTGWSQTGDSLPVIFEYTGNYFAASGSTGQPEDAGLGYGLSQGKYIWVSLPYISAQGSENATTWWGDELATVRYAKLNVPRIIEQYNANKDAVILCGFSRGAIGVNYLGLYDDEIAKLWTAFISHDHFDGVRAWRGTDWGAPLQAYRARASSRLRRVQGRPYLVCQPGEQYGTKEWVDAVLEQTDNFTYLNVDTRAIFGSFPHPLAKSSHTDRWPLLPSKSREVALKWLNGVATCNRAK